MKVACITPIKHLTGLFEELCSYVEVVDESYITKENLKKLLTADQKIEGLFCNPNKMDYKLDYDLLEGTSVKIINTASTGLNHIDLEACAKLNIKVLSLTKDYDLIKQLPSTAELAFGLTMSLLRHIPQSFDSVKQGEWDYEKFIGRQARGLTAGIVGYGRLGTLMAKYCAAFDMEVLIYDPYKEAKDYQQVKSLNTLAEKCDVVSLHVHVSEETKKMVNYDFFSKMNPRAYLINTSRGDIVDEEALIQALRNKNFAGYGTDVVTDEFGNLKDSPILKGVKEGLNIIVTPHTGGMTWEGQQRAYQYAINKFKDLKIRF